MRIAIVGTGISGLGAAYLLSRAHDVEVFERESARRRPHVTRSRTTASGSTPASSSTTSATTRCSSRLFRELGVRTQPSEMSFSVSCDGCGLEYSGTRPFAQPGNTLSPRFHGLLVGDRPLAAHGAALARRGRLRVGTRCAATSTSAATRGGSASTSSCRSPRRSGRPRPAARSSSRPRTRSASSTTTGCSASAASAGSPSRAAAARTSTRLLARLGGRVTARARRPMRSGAAPTASTLVTDDGERRQLRRRRRRDARRPGARRCSPTRATTSGACSAASRTRRTRPSCTRTRRSSRARRRARASWNYRLGDHGRPTLTYYLNRLQRIDGEHRLLRDAQRARAGGARARAVPLRPPALHARDDRAQRALPALSGQRRTWYAGAHHGNGFHEDGLASGVRAAAGLGVAW